MKNFFLKILSLFFGKLLPEKEIDTIIGNKRLDLMDNFKNLASLNGLTIKGMMDTANATMKEKYQKAETINGDCNVEQKTVTATYEQAMKKINGKRKEAIGLTSEADNIAKIIDTMTSVS